MNIEIRKLTPELAEDYVHFFDVTPHSEKADNDDCKCYCVWWCNDDHTNEVFENSLSTKDKRRNYAIQNINANKIQGYLAYCDDKVVGWCNANTKADCQKCFCWKMLMGFVPIDENIKVKSIFCFAVAPEMRRKGISTMLLERVCKDAVQEEFDCVEAYPFKEFLNEAEDFVGPAQMYKNHGFTVHYEGEKKFVMRKQLNK